MQYGKMKEGFFLRRPNRFTAEVRIDGVPEICHVKNTGRCRELLLPDTRVWLEESDDPKRKTKYSLISVEKQTAEGSVIVNMDSQAPNAVVKEWLTAHKEEFGLEMIRPETFYRESRFDFYLEWMDGSRGYLEVKGVTLDEDGVARFPDAPTERGVRHMEHLIEGAEEGLRNGILFVIQMKGIRRLEPNDRTHKAFGDTLRRAAAAGVSVRAFDCLVTADTLEMDREIPVVLGE